MIVGIRESRKRYQHFKSKSVRTKRNYATHKKHHKPKQAPQKQSKPIAKKLPEIYDVLIVGGGMVGSSFACGLASGKFTKNIKVGIVDFQKPAEMNPLPDPSDFRVFAINPASKMFFEDIGVWESMKNARVSPYSDMQVWDASGNGQVNYSRKDTGLEQLGHIIEHHVIQAAIYEKIETLENVDFIYPESVENISYPENGSNDLVDVKLKNRDIRTRLLIGSDGSNSMVRKSANISWKGYGYNQKGVVATVKLEKSSKTAWQRFLKTGPIALLPLYDDYGSIVWSTTPSIADEICSIKDKDKIAEILNDAFTQNQQNNISGKFKKLSRDIDSIIPKPVSNGIKTLIGEPFQEEEITNPPKIISVETKCLSFPLQTAQASEYVKQRVALLGDSCHVVHPFAGQGVNLGFSDSQALIQTLSNAIEVGSDIGDISTLKEYEREQYRSNTISLVGLDCLKRLFDSDWDPLVFTRNMGLNLTNNTYPVKKILIDIASGRGNRHL
eukprot:TRINITY_DN8487_c0_g1_i1.p1 TRINITY_DN8487_c0_g1~~TRINITY_DN8487_c0_g1_i1.p1  ORF type:complete len:499 (-),score=110.86 TRINITY_DN8487_c0_g1_i1:34-1530(-)